MIIRGLLEQRDRADYIADWLAGVEDYLTTYTGENVNQSNALTLSAVFDCVNIIADDIGKLPLHVFKMTGEDRFIDRNHPVSYLLTVQPNEAMNPITFWRLIDIKRQLWGNGYFYIQTDYNGFPVELIPMPSEYVLPVIDSNGTLWYTLNIPNLEPRKIPSWDMFHVKGFSTDGVTGHSTLGYARETLGVGLAEQKFEGQFYQKGMKLGGVLEVPSKLDPDAKNKVRQEFEKYTAGIANMHRVAVLDLGQKFTKLDMPLKDAQFVESRTFHISEVARFWKMPLYKLQEGKQAYSSNEQQALDYLITTLDPHLVQYEQEMRIKLFVPSERKKRYTRYNRAALLRADLKAQAEFLKVMVQNGVYTLNEARAYQELNRYVPDQENMADHLLVSKNYSSIENLDASAAQPIVPEPVEQDQESEVS